MTGIGIYVTPLGTASNVMVFASMAVRRPRAIQARSQCNDIRSQDVQPEYMRFSASLDLSPVDYQPNTGPRLGFVSKDCRIRCVGFGPGLLDSVICRSRGASLSLFTGPGAVPPSKTMDAPLYAICATREW